MPLTPVASPTISWLISREAFRFKRNNRRWKERAAEGEEPVCGFPHFQSHRINSRDFSYTRKHCRSTFSSRFVNECFSSAHFILFGWLWAGIVLRLRMWIITDQQITKSKQTNTKQTIFFFKIILKICWTQNWDKKFFTLNYTCKTKK